MRSLLAATAMLAAFAGTPAGAGGPTVARLVGVSGNVLVSTGSSIASAGEALRLAPGMRVLVTLNSAATVEYDGGCRVPLKAGERLEVRSDPPCPQRPGNAVVGLLPAGEVRR